MRTTGANLKTTYNNGGESIMAEMPGAYFSVGEVLGATADTIPLAPAQPLPEPIRLRRDTLSVVIVDGTGLGQYREGYTSGTTYALMEDWDVIPDRTSKFSLIAPNDNITAYRNELTDNQRGVWLYGDAIDAVVADNTLTNTDGIYISSTAAVPTGRYTPVRREPVMRQMRQVSHLWMILTLDRPQLPTMAPAQASACVAVSFYAVYVFSNLTKVTHLAHRL